MPPPSLETSPITDSDTAKRTVFQRSYSVVASEYDKQHSASPARVKAVPRRRVHSGDAGELMSRRCAHIWARRDSLPSTNNGIVFGLYVQ